MPADQRRRNHHRAAYDKQSIHRHKDAHHHKGEASDRYPEIECRSSGMGLHAKHFSEEDSDTRYDREREVPVVNEALPLVSQSVHKLL